MRYVPWIAPYAHSPIVLLHTNRTPCVMYAASVLLDVHALNCIYERMQRKDSAEAQHREGPVRVVNKVSSGTVDKIVQSA